MLKQSKLPRTPRKALAVSRHPITVPRWHGTNRALGVAIGRMRYDQVVEVLEGLKIEFETQSEADFGRKRYRLWSHLLLISAPVNALIGAMQKICRICQPHLDREIALQRAEGVEWISRITLRSDYDE